MGTVSVLSRTSFGRTRGAVLAVLYGHVGDSFHLRQLSRLTKITLGAVQRELRQLVDAGLVTRRASGNHVLYSANEANQSLPR
jgi:DNA-binding MarR family transcriptional regulator